MSNWQYQIDHTADRIAGLENFIHEFLPLVIAGSSNRALVEERLQRWAEQETGEDREHHHQVEMAADVLEILRSL